MHLQFSDSKQKDVLNLDIDISPPNINFGPKQYVDGKENVTEDPMFNGDPSFKKDYLEKHRPPGWFPEWLKTQDMREVGEDPNLLRGGRIRFFNGIIEDILIEEVKYTLYIH